MKKMKPCLLSLYSAVAVILCGCSAQQQKFEPISPATSLSHYVRHELFNALGRAESLTLVQLGPQRRTISLNRHEQETVHAILERAIVVDHHTSSPTPSMAPQMRIVCTDKNGKRIFDEEVHIISAASSRERAHAEGACLALRESDYRLWQYIINRDYPEVSEQEDAEAAAQHQQAVVTLHQLLQRSASVKIQYWGNTCYCVRLVSLNKKQTKEICTLLKRVKPLPFKGRIQGLTRTTTTLCFYDAQGQQIGTLTAEDITDSAAARTPQQCEAKESMFLSRQDFKRFQKLIRQ